MNTKTKLNVANKANKVDKVDPKALLIVIHKTKGTKTTPSETTRVNANAIHAVTPDELKTAGNVRESLCLNLMAGMVDAGITSAAAVRGRLQKLLPKMERTDILALSLLLTTKTETIRKAWTLYVDNLKVVRGITLQAMAKAVKGKKATQKDDTLKDLLCAWVLKYPKLVAKLPESLVDIFIDKNVIAEEETKQKAA